MSKTQLDPIWAVSEQFIRLAITNPLQDEKCLHLRSCNQKWLSQFTATGKSLWKLYLMVHLVPLIVFKRTKLLKKYVEIVRQSQEINKGILKRVYKIYAVCMWLQFGGEEDFLFVNAIFWHLQWGWYIISDIVLCIAGGFFSGASLMFESQSRQAQISLFVLNKGIEVLYNLGIRRGLPLKLPQGQSILMGVCIAVICFHYLNHREAIRRNYLSVLDKLLGDI